MKLIFIDVSIHQDTKIDLSTDAVCVIRIDISGSSGNPDRNICMKLFLHSPCHCDSALYGIDSILIDHHFIYTRQYLRLILICHITSGENSGCTFRIRDHRCDHSRCTALHRRDCRMCINKSLNNLFFICCFLFFFHQKPPQKKLYHFFTFSFTLIFIILS